VFIDFKGNGAFPILYFKPEMDNSGETQDERKVKQPSLETCSVCQKINYIEIRKQKKGKTMSYEVLEMSTALSNAYIHFSPMFDATR
jgi:hypothetical protein